MHSYFDQDLQRLSGKQTPLAYLSAAFRLNRTALIAALVRIGVPYDKAEHPIKTLNGGQRSRLLLLAMQMLQPNLLPWTSRPTSSTSTA